MTPVRRGFLTVTATLAPCVCVCYITCDITTSAAWHWQDLKLHRHGDGPDIPSWESTNRVLHGLSSFMAGSAALLWAVISLLCYGLLLSGILYDVIVAPPSSGLFVDVAGKQRSLPMRSDLESAQGKCAAKDLLHFPDRVHAHTHTHTQQHGQAKPQQAVHHRGPFRGLSCRRREYGLHPSHGVCYKSIVGCS